MNIKQTYFDILSIIPENKHRKLFIFFIKSILNGLLDLISMAYVVPILILFFDPKKLESMVSTHLNYTINLHSSWVLFLSLGLLLLFFIKTIIQTKFNSALYRFLFDISTELSMASITNFINEKYLQFQKEDKGKILQSITTVPDDFCRNLLHSFIFLFSEIFVLIIILTSLLILYFKITLIILLVVLSFSTFIYFIQRRRFLLFDTIYHKSESKANNHILNILDGFLEIKSSQNEEYFLNEYKKEKSLLNNVSAELISYYSNYSKYLEIFLILCLAILTFFSFQKNDTIVLFSILGAVCLRLIPSISKIMNGITMINSHFYTIEVLNKIKHKKERGINIFNSTIELRNIYFSYGKNAILKNCNINIKKGSFIGLKGNSGIGKTTFIYLILGVLEPQKGNYLIDEKEINIGNFLSFANYVPQQPFLFKGSIIDNIVMGQEKANINYDYIFFLCKKLALHDVIEKLNNGYKTILEHNSLRLSGGQKQRLAIVRALYTKPDLLILDEATNQQNKSLEQQIFIFLKELSINSKTTIINVSHNKDVDSFLDDIYIIKDEKLENIIDS
ncbi:ATP-binding cassette domain-containing protein [Flavivirga algicola]|uniref:ABC transporter ATP-binding protein n=1 Tax=Flavivirga algicola TaxID=2729136 RepID=A0ABX1RWD9_9FLAO|nr:ABC transporter ATP-binding protein [Flavivirga algicola]NMH86665.1 ABC transporter ATP-binding protein [Flavivirga algicola]